MDYYKKQVITRIICAIIGYILLFISMKNDNAWLIILSVIIIGGPALFAFWRRGFGGVFDFHYVNETRYSDGTIVREGDGISTLIVKLIMGIIMIFISVLIVPFQVIFYTIFYAKAKKDSYAEVPFINGILIWWILGVVVFIATPIIFSLIK